MQSARLLAIFAFLALATTGLAQDTVHVTGTRTGALELNTRIGTVYELDEHAFITDLVGASSSNGAIFDRGTETTRWHITNSGTIGALFVDRAPYCGLYIQSAGGAEIHNLANGLISGGTGSFTYAYWAGIRFTSASGLVVNSGTIEGNSGISFDVGSGTITNTGHIHGRGGSGIRSGDGTRVEGGNLLVENTGTISSASSHAVALLNPVGGTATLLNTNGGLITNGAEAAGTTYTTVFNVPSTYILNDNATITGSSPSSSRTVLFQSGVVSATLINTNNALIAATGASPHTILLDAAGSTLLVENTAGATISSENSSAILINKAATATIRNTTGGLITAVGSGTGYATIIANVSGASLTIENSSTIRSENNRAIHFESGTHTLINSGLIIAGGTAITTATNASEVNIFNTGTIAGSSGIAIRLGGVASATITSTLTLGTGSEIIGDVVSSRSTGNHLALVGTGSEDSSFLGVSGANSFNRIFMDGEYWELSGTLRIGSSDPNAIQIRSGTLALTGTLVIANPGVTIFENAALELGRDIDTIFSNTITGAGTLIKTGAGILTLASSNNTHAATRVLEGTLVGNIGSGTLEIAAGATYDSASAASLTLAGLLGSGTLKLSVATALVFDTAADTTTALDFSGDILGGSQLLKTGAGTLELASATAITIPAVAIVEGTLRLANQTQLASSSITLGSGTTFGLIAQTTTDTFSKNLTLDGAGGGFASEADHAFAGATLGSGDFYKSGAATLDITGATLGHTGDIKIVDGVLRATSTVLDDRAISGAGTIEFNETAAATFSGALSGAVSLLKTGAGSLILSAANTNTGDTTIAEGLLSGNIGTGALNIAASGTYRAGVAPLEVASLTGDGTIDLNGQGLSLHSAVDTTGTYAFAGNMLNAPSFTKTGAGILELASTSTITISTATIAEGTLRLASQTQLASSSITLGSGTTFGLIAQTTTDAFSKNLTLDGAGGGFASEADHAFTGATTGSGNFHKSGSATLDITGATLGHTGDIQIAEGILRATAAVLDDRAISGGGTIEFNETVAATFSGTLSGAVSLLKTGAGSLALDAVNTNTGDTTIAEGLLSGNIGTGALNIAASGTYRAGAAPLEVASLTGDGTIDLNGQGLSLHSAADTTGTYAFAGSMLNVASFTKTGAGILELASTSTITIPAAAIAEGTLRLASQTQLASSSITLGSGTTFGLIAQTRTDAFSKNLTLDGAGGGFASEVDHAFTGTTLGSGDFHKSGSATLDITGATLGHTGGIQVADGILRATSAVLDDRAISGGGTIEFNEAADATFSGTLSGAVSLLKTGAGSLALDAVNTSTGDTTIAAGLLSGNIGTGALHIAESGTYLMNTTDASVLASVTGAGVIDLAGNALILDITAGTGTYAFTGRLQNASDFVKTGSGELILAPGASFSAHPAVRVENGALVLVAPDILATASIVYLGSSSAEGFLAVPESAVASEPVLFTGRVETTGLGGGFDLGAGVDAAFTGTISGEAALIKTGLGRLDLTDAVMSRTGPVQIRDGILALDARSTTGNTSVAAGATVELSQRTDATLNAAFTGAGNLLKTGSATLALTAAPALTGTYAIAEGTLRADADNFFASAARVTTAAAGTLDLAGRAHEIARLDNNGTILFNASVNSYAGIVASIDTLIVSTAASGSGAIRVVVSETSLGSVESTPAGTGSSEAVFLEFQGTGTLPVYNASLAQRSPAAPGYEWTVAISPDARRYSLAASLQPEVPAAGGLDAAGLLAGKASLEALANRLADSRATVFQFWLNGLYRRDWLHNNLYSNARADTHGAQIGAEWAIPFGEAGDATIAAGLFADTAQTRLRLAARSSDSTTDTVAAGLFVRYRTDSFYATLLMRASREDSEASIFGVPGAFKTDGSGFAFVAEAGGILPIDNLPFVLEPSARFTVQRHTLADTTDQFGHQYSIDCADALEGRIALRLSRAFALGSGTRKFTPWVRAAMSYDWDGRGHITVAADGADSARFKNDLGDFIGALDAGFEFDLLKNLALTIDAGWANGTRLKTLRAAATISCSW